MELNSFVKQCEEWNETTIIARAKKLYKIAEEIWWFPQTDYLPDENEHWIYWDEDFEYTNTLITKIRFMDLEINTSNITDVYRKVNAYLLDLDSTIYLSDANKTYSTHGEQFRAPIEISQGIYIESNISSSGKINAIRKLAEIYELDSKDIQFLVQQKDNVGVFDINNEESFSSLKVGQLTFQFFKYLIATDKITADEIEQLKDKAYTKGLFNRSDYPAVANNRGDNRGLGTPFRYRKQPLLFKGKDVYISTQWFEGNRQELISWYKAHI